ncbi:MAG: hypothetical protein MUC36_27040 [Planctomycetes bacterium]|jgi:hypothetical protein|nr:hypothetical protein [Planctomycetota bacterium]
MMRTTAGGKLKVNELGAATGRRRRPRNHDELIAAVEAGTKPDDRRGGVLFLGSCQPAAMVSRLAQIPQRHDRSPGRWSHVALVLDWPTGARPDQIVGLECALDPADPDAAVPERNGVTPFHMGRYRDSRRYPNMAFGALCSVPTGTESGEKKKKGRGKDKEQVEAETKVVAASPSGGPLIDASFKERLRNAALRPADDTSRYPLWEWLGVWKAFVHGVGENPLGRGIAHPGAAFVEYVYRSVGIDMSPGALSPSTSPEVLWATLLYWHQHLAAGSGRIQVWTSMTDPDNLARTAKDVAFNAALDA